MDQFIQQDTFGSDQDEWDWSELSFGWFTPLVDLEQRKALVREMHSTILDQFQKECLRGQK